MLFFPTTLYRWFCIKFRLFPIRSPLLRKSFLLSFPLGTKMFQFPRFALSFLSIQKVVLSFLIRRPPDQSLYPTPRSISLVIASFIASKHQGILRKLSKSISWFQFQTDLEVSRFEPLTFAVQRQRSTNWAILPLGYPRFEPGTSPLSGVCSNQLS